MAFVLIGFMGAGKTTVAREFAEALGGALRDTDALLEERLGHSVGEEFARAGEAAFRAAEAELACDVLAQSGVGDVVALGGGSVTSERVRDALNGHVTVLLEVGAEQAWARVHRGGGPQPRPLARDPRSFAALLAARRPLYESIADAFLPQQRRGHAVRALPALERLASAPTGTRMVWATSASGDYPVVIAPGLVDGTDPAPLLDLWPLDRGGSRAFAVSDTNVAALYGDRLGPLSTLVAIAPGEPSKSLQSAEVVWEALVEGQMTRADHIVALGGGVVGDVAGFCAATYQRGVACVQVPTTLVAQVDSAYGGKTGVDLPRAKNYVGAYHQPAGVIVDPGTLGSLPAPELAAGWVEVLKTALIAGGPLWDAVSAGAPVDADVILDCARIKLAVVAEDERDAGRRQVLNLGHTVGHAIEAATGYARYRHGEAVGLGLLVALRLSGQEDLRERVRGLLAAHALPVALSDTDPDAVVAASDRDKKRLGDRVPFVLLRAPGEIEVGCELEPDEVRAAIAELAA